MRVGVELIEHIGSGANEHGVSFEHGLVSDVFENHGFAKSIGAEHDEVSPLTEEVECHGGFDGAAVDFLGPVPIEVDDGFEAADLGMFEPAYETTSPFVFDFDAGELFEHLNGGKLFLGGAGEKVIDVVSDVFEPEGRELKPKLIRRRQSGRAHRRPPGLGD